MFLMMTGLNRRGVAIWHARTGIEAMVFGLVLVLGGTIGFGTVWFTRSAPIIARQN